MVPIKFRRLHFPKMTSLRFMFPLSTIPLLPRFLARGLPDRLPLSAIRSEVVCVYRGGVFQIRSVPARRIFYPALPRCIPLSSGIRPRGPRWCSASKLSSLRW